MARTALLIALALGGLVAPAAAQDMPGIELCTRENNLDRRTGCLQSNVDYLHKLIAKNAASAQQKQAAADAEIAALKAAVAELRASLDKIQAAGGKSDKAVTKPEMK